MSKALTHEVCFSLFPPEDAYKKEYTINENGVDKNIVVEISDTAGQEEFAAGLHDKVRQTTCKTLAGSPTA